VSFGKKTPKISEEKLNKNFIEGPKERKSEGGKKIVGWLITNKIFNCDFLLN
jgi:hypothetical protein